MRIAFAQVFYPLVPPTGFSGHVIFVNGSPRAQVHLHVEHPFEPGTGDSSLATRIAPGEEGFEVVTAAL